LVPPKTVNNGNIWPATNPSSPIVFPRRESLKHPNHRTRFHFLGREAIRCKARPTSSVEKGKIRKGGLWSLVPILSASGGVGLGKVLGKRRPGTGLGKKRREVFMHKITIIGHLGRDPEMRYTPEGQAVTNFSVASS